jgi:predicted transcriptional regulator
MRGRRFSEDFGVAWQHFAKEAPLEETLFIRVTSEEAFRTELEHIMDLVEKDEFVGPYSILSFTTPNALRRFMSSERFRMLQTIRAQPPESVYGLAKALNRNRMAVIADLRVLAALGLVEMSRTGGSGRRRSIPRVPYSQIRIQLDVGNGPRSVSPGKSATKRPPMRRSRTLEFRQ